MRKLILAVLFFLTAPSLPAPMGEDKLPLLLKDWVPWVLHDKDERLCPVFYNHNQRSCIWHTLLELILNDNGGAFTQQVQVYKKTWVQIPGDKLSWPLNVTVNNSLAAVVETAGVPGLNLAPGTYTITGNFTWKSLPESFKIAPDSALVNLIVNNQRLFNPQISRQGKIWLKTSFATDKEDRVGALVFRKIMDNNPLEVLTRIELDVAGKVRDLEINHVFLSGFIPFKITSTLPSRLNKNNSVTVKLKPGQWVIEFSGRFHGQVKQLVMPDGGKEFPKEEIWSFQPNSSLRTVKITGATALDPGQTNLPVSWRNLPAYLVSLDKPVSFSEIYSGGSYTQLNKLKLARELWLDFSGQGFTVRDKINGTVSSSGRIETTSEIIPGRIAINGKPQLITTINDSSGVEIREHKINLAAESRYVGDFSSIPANGWSEEFEQVSANLYLPAGWRLFTSWGADNNPVSWLEKWDLLDLFFFLLAVAAIYKLWGVPGAVLGFATLGLIWHENGAPTFIWIALLAGVALMRVLPNSWFKKVVTGFFAINFILALFISIPFAMQQVRLALYPQLEKTAVSADSGGFYATAQSKIGKINVRRTSDFARDKKYFDNIDKNLAVQTGPGIPDWRWGGINFSWHRAVTDKDSINLVLIPPWLNIILNLLRVALVITLLWLFYREFVKYFRKFLSQGLSVAAVIFLGAGILPSADVMASDIPDSSLLSELANKLTLPPDCLPNCAQASKMAINILNDSLTIRMQVHAADNTAIPLPVNTGTWVPETVLVNGEKALGLNRDNRSNLWLALPGGIYDITLRGDLSAIDSLQLPLKLSTKQITYDVKGWKVSGLGRKGGKIINLTRLEDKKKSGEDFAGIIPPPFFRVTRVLEIGLEWHVNTTVSKLSAVTRPLVIDVPLLVGESVITDGVNIKDEYITVSIPAGKRAFSWRSRLPISDEIKLTALDDDNLVESWQVNINPLRNYNAVGIKPVKTVAGGNMLADIWQPWPRDELVLRINKPEALSGKTLTVNNSRLNIKPDKVSSNINMVLNLKSSKGERMVLRFAQESKLKNVKLNRKRQTAKLINGELTVPITPGEHNLEIAWSEDKPNKLLYTVPSVSFGIDSVNNYLDLKLPYNRWVLFTGGPTMGPAVLFWGQLIVILLFSLILGRTKITPLKSRHWFLLGVGLSVVTIYTAFIVVAWLLILGLRCRLRANLNGWRFNLLQIGIFLFSLIALASLVTAVYHGLLGAPDMQIAGNGSSIHKLSWFSDRIGTQTPSAWVVSAPIFVYKILMLLWALWLAFSLLYWLKWGWEGYGKDKLWSRETTG